MLQLLILGNEVQNICCVALHINMGIYVTKSIHYYTAYREDSSYM